MKLSVTENGMNFIPYIIIKHIISNEVNSPI